MGSPSKFPDTGTCASDERRGPPGFIFVIHSFLFLEFLVNSGKSSKSRQRYFPSNPELSNEEEDIFRTHLKSA